MTPGLSACGPERRQRTPFGAVASGRTARPQPGGVLPPQPEEIDMTDVATDSIVIPPGMRSPY